MAPENTASQTVTPPQQLAPQAAEIIQAEDTKDESFVAEPKTITVATDKTAVTIDTVGGILRGYELKNFQSKAEARSPYKDMLRESEGSYTLFLGLKGYDSLTPEKVFQVVSDEELPRGARRVTLAWQDKNIRLEKTFDVGSDDSPYVVRTSYKVLNHSDKAYQLTPYLENHLRQKDVPVRSGFLGRLSGPQPDHFGSVYYKGDRLFARHAADKGATKNFEREAQESWDGFQNINDTGAVAWSSITDRYFLYALAPNLGADSKISSTTAEFVRDGDFLVNRFYTQSTLVNPGEASGDEFLSYMGPKKRDEMAAVGVALEKIVDYGWFDVIAIGILWFMTQIHKVVPNWGLVIITLTFIVKLILQPINKKSMMSMKAMQLLQPKLQEIKKKYPEDKQKQNDEVMKLFRTHKVNPLGGCLPMLLQMPIYIALYKVLWNAIELYHSPFLWYRDLSAPDPYFVAPILLGLFMFLQQKLTPSATTDPAQQKMMLIMPVMFSAFMLFLPVGLVIYIFVNTFMSVLQQFMMQRDLSFKDLLTGKWQAKRA